MMIHAILVINQMTEQIFDAIEQWLVRQVFTLEIGVQSSVASPNLGTKHE